MAPPSNHLIMTKNKKIKAYIKYLKKKIIHTNKKQTETIKRKKKTNPNSYKMAVSQGTLLPESVMHSQPFNKPQ